jgi:hypothetical protein
MIKSRKNFPQIGDLFCGSINDLSNHTNDGWQRRDITFHKKEINKNITYAYPSRGDYAILIDVSGKQYRCNFTDPEAPEHICLGEPQNLKSWYLSKKEYAKNYVKQVRRDGHRDQVFFEYTGEHPKFYIYTEKEFASKCPDFVNSSSPVPNQIGGTKQP